MERLADIAVVFLGCAGALVLAGPGAASVPSIGAGLVACLLLAVIVTALSEWMPARTRALLPAAYCILCLAVPDGVAFLPLAAYELARLAREPWPARAAVAAPALPLVAAWGLDVRAAVCATVMCVCAVALSLRTSSLLAQRAMMRRAYDDLRAKGLEGRGAPAEGADAAARTRADEGGDALAACARDAASPEARPLAFSQLTEREYEVVRLIADGLDNHEIASAAFISEGTVRNRISSVLQKTGLKNRTQLAVAWWRARS